MSSAVNNVIVNIHYPRWRAYKLWKHLSVEWMSAWILRELNTTKKLANKWRFPHEPAINIFGQVAPVNLFEYSPDLQRYRIVYLYIEPTGCELVERCVGGSGWRRLLVFSTTAVNFRCANFTSRCYFLFYRYEWVRTDYETPCLRIFTMPQAFSFFTLWFLRLRQSKWSGEFDQH